MIDAVTSGAAGVNDHTFDFGFSPQVYDLALKKDNPASAARGR